ncbi:NAD(P)H-dependent glycerol-3-phosphate dehydrogenase [Fluviibacterium sp. DFM31]|uniref:Glycerol-3-phosphate dehydrogenase [NAD(P)+] n=1 Tax=Meridianimarinicoccus marinus TaxID=3231483 RepID=A0ABV3L521_9RHOB
MALDFTPDDILHGAGGAPSRIAVIGAGAWGTALASVARQAGRGVTLWGRDAEVTREIREDSRASRYLPDVPLPDGIAATTDMGRALHGAEAALIVTPSATLHAMCDQIRPHLPKGIPLALCCKGIERGSGLPLSQVAEDALPGHPIGALSGPTFAREAALGHPTAATIAFPFNFRDRLHPGQSPAARLALALSAPSFRPYISDDVIGVEVGGAVKNVIAIACGMLTGAGFAENTRALLITRGMAEMTRLALSLGGRTETISGLSGAGDLMLTCSSTTSRNMSLGTQLGRGLARAACFEGRPVVVEGEVNAPSVMDLATRVGVEMPICAAVNAVLHQGAPMEETFARLWSRPLQGESGTLGVSLSNPVSHSARRPQAKPAP